MKTIKNVFLVGIGLIIGFTAETAYADGLVTMHGAACKSTGWELFFDNPNVTYGEGGLFVHELRREEVYCPLTNHWGGGMDWPFALGETTVYLVTEAPASDIDCTMFKLSLFGSRLEVRSGTAIGNTANKRVIVPAFTTERSTTKHNYVLQCKLPPNTVLTNLQYTTTATK
jgi:hypothetical protein